MKVRSYSNEAFEYDRLYEETGVEDYKKKADDCFIVVGRMVNSRSFLLESIPEDEIDEEDRKR